MYKLTLDCETTGLHKTDNRIIQLAFCLSKIDKIIEFHNFYIYVSDYKIPETHVSKIQNETLQNGTDINIALIQLYSCVRKCDLIIGHNVVFDISVILLEVERLLKINPHNLIMSELKKKLENTETFDTMLVSTNLFKLHKYPKLTELYKMLFDSEFEAHNAVYDVLSTFQIFCKIVYQS